MTTNEYQMVANAFEGQSKSETGKAIIRAAIREKQTSIYDMNPLFEHQLLQTRRQFFGDTGLRLGGIAMASLLGSAGTQFRRRFRGAPKPA